MRTRTRRNAHDEHVPDAPIGDLVLLRVGTDPRALASAVGPSPQTGAGHARRIVMGAGG
jgi:hypothetical protein